MKNTTIVLRAFLFVLMISLSFNQVKATPLSVVITSQKNVSCNGGSNGTATAAATGGTSPYTYLWSTNPTQAGVTATGLSAGTYTVGVADASFNTTSVSVTITQPTVFTTTVNVFNHISCNGGRSGMLQAGVSGGVYPYTYVWTPGGETDDTAMHLTAGCYTVTATDAHGCSASASNCLTQPNAIKITISTTPDSGTCDGIATASVTGGTLPYTYLWSNGGTSYINNLLCYGYYCLTLTDGNGCIDTACTYISRNCNNTYNEPICIVTLDTATNKCMVIWGRTNSPPSGGHGHYNIYRDSNNAYHLTHSQALNVLSEYIDPNSDPSAGPVSYELSTFDSCGESVLSSPHTSIYLTTTAGYNVYILNWTAYVGFTPTKYMIYRGPSLSQLTAIDSVATNILTYRDTLPPLGSYYVVEAVSPGGPCIPTTHRPGKSSISLLSGGFSNGFNTGTLLGVSTLENNITNLNVYPNPSSGVFTLNYTIAGNDNVSISIINELGQQVYTEQKGINTGLHTEQLNVSGLASGIYTLRIQSNVGISVRKLLIVQNK